MPLRAVEQGLARAEALTPGSGVAEVRAAVTLSDWAVRGELGWRPSSSTALFAFAEAGARWGAPVAAMAGVGARVRF